MWRTKPRLGPIGADHAQQRNINIWSMGSEVVYSKGNTAVALLHTAHRKSARLALKHRDVSVEHTE